MNKHKQVKIVKLHWSRVAQGNSQQHLTVWWTFFASGRLSYWSCIVKNDTLSLMPIIDGVNRPSRVIAGRLLCLIIGCKLRFTNDFRELCFLKTPTQIPKRCWESFDRTLTFSIQVHAQLHCEIAWLTSETSFQTSIGLISIVRHAADAKQGYRRTGLQENTVC